MLNSDNKRWNLFLFSAPFLILYFLYFLTPILQKSLEDERKALLPERMSAKCR